MKIIEQGHEILFPKRTDQYTWSSLLPLVETAGRTCYKSKSDEAPGEFVRRKLVKTGHHSVIEHVNITVRFITDRGVTHEMVRHRLAAYSQESTRYCDYGGAGDVVFIRPVWCVEPLLGEWDVEPERDRLAALYRRSDVDRQNPRYNTDGLDYAWLAAMAVNERQYKRLREGGWAPQKARSILSNSLKTEIVMTANLREWRHVFELRCSKAAHPQIRELMIPLRDELAGLLPEIFEDLADQGMKA